MEGITVSVYKGLKEYWGRRGYQRLNGSGRRSKVVELGSTRTRKSRLFRWKIKNKSKIRINRIPSPKKLLVWLRDAYERKMLGLANTRVMSTSTSGLGCGALLGGDGGFRSISRSSWSRDSWCLATLPESRRKFVAGGDPGIKRRCTLS